MTLQTALDAALRAAEQALRTRGYDPAHFTLHAVVEGEGGDEFTYALAVRPRRRADDRQRAILAESLRKTAAELERGE